MEVGRAVQAAGAFTAILSALTLIVQHFESLSRFGAGVNRLDSFSQALDDQTAADAEPGIETADGPQLALELVTVQTPGHEHTLIREVTLAIAPGDPGVALATLRQRNAQKRPVAPIRIVSCAL